MTVDVAIAKAIAQAVHDEPSIIDELVTLGLPADLLQKFLPPPRSAMDVAQNVLWARMHDGSWAMAIIDRGETA